MRQNRIDAHSKRRTKIARKAGQLDKWLFKMGKSSKDVDKSMDELDTSVRDFS